MVEAHAYSTDKTRSHNEGYKMTHNDLLPKIASLYSEIEAVSVKFPDIQKECRKNSDGFGKQYENTINENRRLRIAIIGQVKAGKSSFLNTFLFDGEEVLPKAATPKTANLTIIRHDLDCRVEIEFYNQSDWERIISSANEFRSIKEKYDVWMADSNKQGKSIPTNPNSSGVASFKAASEMVEAAKKNGLDIASLIASKRKIINFEDISLMRKQLNEYVGEDGKLTPITKEVYLYVNEPRLMDLEIVDTPGLNDPVPARTERTREMLKTTDVAFFLSQTGGSFFDNNDVELLVSQLPSEGINYFILIGSKYDSALQNYLDAESLAEVEADLKRRLTTHADITLRKFLDSNEYLNPDVKTRLLACLPPIYISSMMHNFAIKEPDTWDISEKKAYNNLQSKAMEWQDFSLDKESLIKIANMSTVSEKYELVKSEKQSILEQKIAALAPAAAQKLQQLICKIRDSSQATIDILQSKGVADLDKQEKQLNKQVGAVKAGVTEVIGDIINGCGSKVVEVKKEIREELAELSSTTEQTGTRKETQTRTGYRTKRFLFWSWESSYDYDVEVTVTFRYAIVINALDNLRKAAHRASNDIEGMFKELIDKKALRLQLLNVIRDSFDAADDSYNPDFFRGVVQKAIEDIKFPSVNINPNTYVDELANQFPEPQQIESNADKLNMALANSMNLLGLYIIDNLEREAKSFAEKLKVIREGLGTTLIDSSLAEISKLKIAMQNKEREIEEYNACIRSCEQISQKVSREIT
jgi:GTPase SAR1 family protein